jgi:hypothetical protein
MGRNFTAEIEEREDGTTMKKVATSAKDASSSMESMSVPTLGQISRDILEHLGHVIDEDEQKLQLGNIRMGPFGVAVEDTWVPLYLRDTKAGIEEASARETLGIKNMDLFNYDPLYATGLPEFLTDKVDGGKELKKKIKDLKNTTPSFFEILILLSHAEKIKVNYAFIEVSSIGYSEGRLGYLKYNYCLLTNLKSDHLDYHGNLSNYHRSKLNIVNNHYKKNSKIIIQDKIVNKKLDKIKNKTILQIIFFNKIIL